MWYKSNKRKNYSSPYRSCDIFEPYVNNIKHISGPTGRGYTLHELNIKGNIITYIKTGIGACNVLDAVLTLGITNCKKVLFVGSVGSLDPNINIGDIIIPEYSISGVGSNRYLNQNGLLDNDCYENKYYPDRKFTNSLSHITDKFILNTNIKKYKGHIFSVDTILAQYAYLDEIVNMGCNCIEMETSAFFDAANICSIESGAVLSVSDNTIIKKSLYSGRTQQDNSLRKKSKEG